MVMRALPPFSDANLPWCAICGRPCERVERDEDEERAKIVFTVYCHGDVETAEVSLRELQSVNGLRFGRAFARALAAR